MILVQLFKVGKKKSEGKTGCSFFYLSFLKADISFDLPDYDDEQIVGEIYDIKIRNAVDFASADVGRYAKSTKFSVDLTIFLTSAHWKTVWRIFTTAVNLCG